MAKMEVGCVTVIEYPPYSDNFVLVEETKKHKKGRFNLPGGSMDWLKDEERWESPFECIVREALEETGLKVEPILDLGTHFYEQPGHIHLAFASIAIGGSLQATKKHPTVESFSFDEIVQMDIEGKLRSDRVIDLISQYREGRGSLLENTRVAYRDELPEPQPQFDQIVAMAA